MRLDEAEACASVAEEDGAAEALVEALAEGVADEELCAVEFSEAQALNRSRREKVRHGKPLWWLE